MPQGRIIKLMPEKGYGFIKDGSGDSRFFHANDLRDPKAFKDLREDLAVEFEPRQGGNSGNGLRAVNVVVVAE